MNRAHRGQLEQRLLVLVTLALVAFGLVMVYSATSASAALGNGDSMSYLKRQSVYALLGIALMLVASRFDYHRLRLLAPDTGGQRVRHRARQQRRKRHRLPIIVELGRILHKLPHPVQPDVLDRRRRDRCDYHRCCPDSRKHNPRALVQRRRIDDDGVNSRR